MNTQQHDETLAETGSERPQVSNARIWASPPKNPGFWVGLPLANQLLFAGSFGCLGLGAIGMVGLPVVEGVQSAIIPYTGAGKRATCLSNLETLSQAFALYAQDNDGHLPPVEVKGASTQGRVTWVTQLRPYTERQSSSTSVWSCPAGSISATDATSAYGLNPVLAGEHVPQGENGATVLLLGDRGTRDDLSLLPPVPGWNAANPTDTTNPTDISNLDFRHDGEAAGVFADGHAGTLSPSATSPLSLWGGDAAISAGLRHIEQRSATIDALVTRLRAGDVTGAGTLLKNSAPLEPAMRDLQGLWMLNWQASGGGSAPSHLASDEVEEVGWHLARAQEVAGHNALRAALDAETRRRAGEERKRVDAAGWQVQTASSGLKVEVPQGWTWGEDNKARYHTASARSPLPGLWVSIEKGDRTSYSGPIAVDWGASEKRLQAKYGSGYKRLRMETTTLLGRPAGLWEYELEKPGSPRLRKRYVGAADGWSAYVLSVTAPANCFEEWRGDFDRVVNSLAIS